MKVVIIGAGIGGLVCALKCANEALDVTVLERAPALAPIGAGIQLPPNATRIVEQLGLLPQLIERGVVMDAIEYNRYKAGELLFRIDADKVLEHFGNVWIVISRVDYHEVLWNAAQKAGVNLRLGAEVDYVDFEPAVVHLKSAEVIEADVVVGADGLWSRTRDQLLDRASPPSESGDLAYRVTISRQDLQKLNDPGIDELLARKVVQCWMGPGRHCVFYPLAKGETFNIVLLGPDNMGHNVRQAPGDLAEMRELFQGWDERLTKIISSVPSVLKWKLFHHKELDTWTKGYVALLGDACHPTLPYLAQGAAMASEDGAVLGTLLGLLNKSGLYKANGPSRERVKEILRLYESLRKSRTTAVVKGSSSNQVSYHLEDGPRQVARDAGFPSSGGFTSCPDALFADWDYMRSLLAFDAVDDSVKAFAKWATGERAKL